MNATKRSTIDITKVNKNISREISGIFDHTQPKINQNPSTKLSRKILHIFPRGMRK